MARFSKLLQREFSSSLGRGRRLVGGAGSTPHAERVYRERRQGHEWQVFYHKQFEDQGAHHVFIKL
jgi:hypothetical protein